MVFARMAPSPLSSVQATRWFDRCAVAVLAAVAIVASATFRDYGLGWDDYTHSEYGELLLRAFQSGFSDRRAFEFVNLYAYGGGFDTFAAIASKFSPFDLWESRRLLGALTGILGLIATWRLARHLGGALAGLVALALLASCPLYYGHMYFNAKDAPFAAAMALATLSLVRAFGDYPSPQPVTILLVGLGFGLAIGTRILGGFAGIDAIAGLLLLAAAEARRDGVNRALDQAGQFLLALVPAAILAYAVMALVWPWGVANPGNPIGALEYFSHFFEKPWRELFEGVRIEVIDMPRRYVPELLALKLPELVSLLGLAGLVGALIVAARGSNTPRRRAQAFTVALAALLPVAVAVATRPAMYNGLRHLLFVVPPIVALGGFAGAAMLDALARRSMVAAAAGAAAIAFGLALPIADMVRLHPYEYVSFNHIAGGVGAARERFMLDYWGLSFKQATAALKATLAQRGETAPPGGWRIAVCGPHRPAQVGLGPNFNIAWDPQGAQFALVLGEFYCRRLDAPVVLDVVRDGVVFARVYDIRGKSFRTLLTIPEP
jgi:4-amino-4-deoxy-L-arabinose transferase-like glycosyltransferase